MLKELLEPRNSAARSGIVVGICLLILARVEAIHDRVIGVERTTSNINAQNVFKPTPVDTLAAELAAAQAEAAQLRAELARERTKPRPGAQK